MLQGAAQLVVNLDVDVLQLDGLTVGRNNPGVVVDLGAGVPEVVIGHRKIGVQLDGPAAVLDGVVVLS